MATPFRADSNTQPKYPPFILIHLFESAAPHRSPPRRLIASRRSHTFRADIDYAHAEALTKVGLIGVKVWICRGEVYEKRDLAPNFAAEKTNANRGGNDRGRGGERRERGGDDNREKGFRKRRK